MDKKSVEGNIDKAKGHLKEGVGGLTGDCDLQREGRADQLKGKLKDALGKLRERTKGALDSLDCKK